MNHVSWGLTDSPFVTAVAQRVHESTSSKFHIWARLNGVPEAVCRELLAMHSQLQTKRRVAGVDLPLSRAKLAPAVARNLEIANDQ